MKIFGSVKELLQLVFRKDAKEITVSPNQSVTYSAATDIQLPDEIAVTQNILSRNSDDTGADRLANKDVDDDSFHITDNGDSSSKVRFDAGAVSAATVRTFSLNDKDVAVEGSGDDDITTNAGSQTLKNKTLIDNSTAVANNADTTKQLILSVDSGTTTSTSTTIRANQTTSSKIIDLPDDTTTMVGTTTTQTLTNKTLTTPNVNEAVNLTATSTELNQLDGNTVGGSTTGDIADIDSAQTLTNKVINADNNTVSNLAHGAEVDNPSSGVHGVTGSVVGTTDSQTLTNKTIDADNSTISNLAHGAEVDNLSSGIHGVTGSVVGTTDTQTLTNKTLDDAITGQEIATPSNPAAGYNKLYFKNDDKLYKLNTAGTEEEIGSGGAGGVGINLIDNSDGAEPLDQSQTNDVGDWIDSSTGTASSSTTTTSEIALYPDIATGIKIAFTNSLEDYTRYRFTMPPALKNMKLGLSWFQITDGTNYTNDDARVELYYNASSNYGGAYTEVALAADDSSGHSYINALDGSYVNSFDEGGNDYYELRIINNAATGANEWLSLNSVTLGPGVKAQGPTISAWQSYTPTFQGFGTTTGVDLDWRQVGDSIEIRGDFTSGTLTAVEGQIGLPSGFTISNPTTSTISCGRYTRSATSVTSEGHLLSTHGDTYLNIAEQDIRDAVNQNPLIPRNASSVFGSSERIVIVTGSIPIQELEGKGTVNTLVEDNLSSWTEYTPSNTQGWGTITSADIWYRRNGEDMELQGRFTAGTIAASEAQIELPSGFTIAKLTSGGTQLVGDWTQNVTGAVVYTTLATQGDTFLNFSRADGSLNPMVPQNGDDISGTSNIVSFNAKVPIAEWAGTQNSLVGFSAATDAQAGLLSRYQTTTFELDNEFTGGELTVTATRIGNVVTLTANGVATHINSTARETSAGVIPADYRPSGDINNAYVSTRRIIAKADGTLTAAYDSSQPSTGNLFSITYVIT